MKPEAVGFSSFLSWSARAGRSGAQARGVRFSPKFLHGTKSQEGARIQRR